MQLVVLWLNSSPIDELRSWSLKDWMSRAKLYKQEKEVSMVTLQAATPRHHHSESLSGILTTNTPLGRRKYQEGGAHRKEFSKATGGKLNMTL